MYMGKKKFENNKWKLLFNWRFSAFRGITSKLSKMWIIF